MSQNHLKQVFLWRAANVVSLQWEHVEPLCDFNKHQLQYNEPKTVSDKSHAEYQKVHPMVKCVLWQTLKDGIPAGDLPLG